TKSFHEGWTGGDLSHGWCSTPLVQMSARILGVTPTSPGFKTIAINPELCDLKWAKGRVPTPHGNVDVSWVLSGNQFTLDVTVPRGTEADVTVPVGHFEHPAILLNGKKASSKIHVSAGTYHFEVTGQFKQ
ncbi:MAG TPA: alpha-L-rhamnosidase C-terminal domain-containing protein, partial [Candidatus Acidoferrum sp.]|nr:alpha-L-rhamnosidase C-terminal domain-containing protein [Candidatus Acidoferrum sp.]